MRKHVAAVYAFARMGDDIADEALISLPDSPLISPPDSPLISPPDSPLISPPAPLLVGEGSRTMTVEERLAMLAHLDGIVDGAAHGGDPIFVAVQNTIVEKKLDRECFHRLIEAFRRDVNFVPMKSWADVLEYCSYSANPVGDIILQLAGDATDESIAYSNDVCTALQITNFLQDRSLDMQRGRDYLPLAIPEVISRTRKLFERGERVTSYVRSVRLKLELKAIVAGGRTMLDACEQTNIEVERPKLGWKNAVRMMRYFFSNQ